MKICVSDIDGTIVNSLGDLTEDTINTLIEFQERGNLLILASGRSYLRMMPIAESLKMNQYNGYLIDVNGLSIYSFKENKRRILNRINDVKLKDLFNYLKKFNAEIKLYCDEAIYTHLSNDIYKLKERIRREMKLPDDYPWTSGEYGWLADSRDGYPIQKLIDNIDQINHEVNKIALCHELDILLDIQAEFNKSCFSKEYNIQFSGARQIDIISKKISKGNALNIILKELKIDINNVYVFGDSENDISMLDLSSNSYLMNNSNLAKNNKKYRIALSNDNEGLAKIVKEIY